jgi:hypothetical protein
VLDALGSIEADFNTEISGFIHVIGYPGAYDPNLMYCASTLSYYGSNPFIGNCGMTGGASGGPWIIGPTSGNPKIVSVHSWGLSDGSPGSGGPRLTTTAGCVFAAAQNGVIDTIEEKIDGDQGVIVNCPTLSLNR